VEKPESHWETLGEQLLPTKANFARKPVSHPPLIIDSKHQAAGTSSLSKPLMFDETSSLEHHSSRCTAKEFVSRINDISGRRTMAV
jgi:hypothetical protein